MRPRSQTPDLRRSATGPAVAALPALPSFRHLDVCAERAKPLDITVIKSAGPGGGGIDPWLAALNRVAAPAVAVPPPSDPMWLPYLNAHW